MTERPHFAQPTACDFATSVVSTLQAHGHVAVFAGGCVRDMLLAQSGRSDPDDYDVATDATPQRVREIFGRSRTLAVGESFGVIVVLSPKYAGKHLQVEVATFRAEGEYSDGRRPDTVVFCTAEEDAERRDFTINGMFYDPIKDQVLDYVGGQDDLERGIVRAIGDPHARIAEDKLRMLRAIRFTARFEFQLDEATRSAVETHAHEIQVVSWERITQELTKILLHPTRAAAIQLLADVGLLQEVLPEVNIAHLPQIRGTLARLKSPSFPTAMAALLRGVPAGSYRQPSARTASAVGLRMKVSNEDRKAMLWLSDHREMVSSFDTLELAEKKTLLAHPLAIALLDLIDAETHGADNSATIEAREFLQRTPAQVLDPEPLVTGEDLKRLGLQPSRRFKELLEAVRREQLNETLADRDAALTWLRKNIDE